MKTQAIIKGDMEEKNKQIKLADVLKEVIALQTEISLIKEKYVETTHQIKYWAILMVFLAIINIAVHAFE